MSLDLSDRIRAYAAQIEDDAEHVTVAELERMIGDVSELSATTRAGGVAQSRRSRVPAWVAVATAALFVLVAVGVPILLFGGRETVVVEEPTTTAEVTVTTAPSIPVETAPVSPDAAVEPMDWTRVVDPAVFGADGSLRIADIAAGDTIAVAAGSDDADGELDAAVRYSVDGVAWSRVPHDEEVFGGSGYQRINAVVAFGSGFVAVGSDGEDTELGTDAAVWRSDDGISWTRVSGNGVFSEDDVGLVMNDVAFDGSAMVAVGEAYHRTEPFAIFRWADGSTAEGVFPASPHDVDVDIDAAVWRSVDGVTWDRVVNADETFGGDTIRQRMNAVAAGGPGFVAVGQEGFNLRGIDDWTPLRRFNPEGNAHVTENVAAVWTSADGQTWTRVPDASSLEHSGGEVTGWAEMTDIADSGSGLVAVGYELYEHPIGGATMQPSVVWLSPDGLAWRRATGKGAAADKVVIAVTPDGDLVSAGGAEPQWSTQSFTAAAIWISSDGGNSWTRHPHDNELFGGSPQSRDEAELFGPGSIESLASYGDAILAAGTFDRNATVWVGTWNRTDG